MSRTTTRTSMEDVHARDPRIAELAAQIDRTTLTEIADQTFTDETIYLDGRSFLRCTFTRCVFRIELGRFKLKSNKFVDPRFETVDINSPAGTVLQIEQNLRDSIKPADPHAIKY